LQLALGGREHNVVSPLKHTIRPMLGVPDYMLRLPVVPRGSFFLILPVLGVLAVVESVWEAIATVKNVAQASRLCV